MTESKQDAGVISVLLERLNKQRLPRALELNERLDAGEQLTEFDFQFLTEVQQDIQQVQPLISRHPEYEPLVKKVLGLYMEIAEKALENG